MGVRITILAALNLEYCDWYTLFQNKPLVDALLDRLQHHCITIRINGPSLRTPESKSPPTSKPPASHTKQSVAPNNLPSALRSRSRRSSSSCIRDILASHFSTLHHRQATAHSPGPFPVSTSGSISMSGEAGIDSNN